MRYTLKQIHNTAIKLREAGFDAKYMNSGHSGWKAIGAPVKLQT